MKYVITTEIDGTTIVQTVQGSSALLPDVLATLSRKLADVSDAHTRQALITLGWTPPRERKLPES